MTKSPTSATDNPKLIDTELLNHAIQFAVAADAYAKANQLKDWFVLYFTIGQSIELALKAYILRTGDSEKKLKALKHDLEANLRYAQEKGFKVQENLSREELSAISLLNHWHGQHITRYPLAQGYVIPNPKLIRMTLNRILRAVYVELWGQDQYNHDHDRRQTPGLTIDPDAGY